MGESRLYAKLIEILLKDVFMVVKLFTNFTEIKYLRNT